MERWPSLPLDSWESTYKTLHRWTQIVGKIRLGLCAPSNHWWHTSLRFHARGLTTTLMPVDSVRQLEIAFDFVEHVLHFRVTDGSDHHIELESISVAEFYGRVQDVLGRLNVAPPLWPMPVEIPEPIDFREDHENAAYDSDSVAAMWRILSSSYDVFSRYRGAFVGKCSPLHFFWGAFDLALTRFSGRPNPSPPQDAVMGPAYSHEVISHGLWFGGDWPGGGRIAEPLFYGYAVPTPDGLKEAAIEPELGRWSEELGEFILPYEQVRKLDDPDSAILSFLQSTYERAATLAEWPRDALEL